MIITGFSYKIYKIQKSSQTPKRSKPIYCRYSVGIINKKSIFTEDYPVCEEKWLVKDENEVAVQVNSKIKTKIVIPNDITEDEIKEILYKDEKVLPFIEGKEIKKLIIIPRRLINVIV